MGMGKELAVREKIRVGPIGHASDAGGGGTDTGSATFSFLFSLYFFLFSSLVLVTEVYV
jgi:hypothetical protein